MEVYLPPDESELFKDVCLDQKDLFQIMKGTQAFIFKQSLPLQLSSDGLAATLFSKHFPLSGLLHWCLCRVSSLFPSTAIVGNDTFNQRPNANL